MRSCISHNCKTGRSVDFSTDCPKRRDGRPCKYCYVETSRRTGFNAKQVYDSHYNGDVLRLRRETVDRLNACGGIRLFSFGDYMPTMDTDLEAFFADCETVGLKVKAITKQVDFVRRYADRCAVVHVSIDTIGDGVPIAQAVALRATYPSVRIRAVVLSHADLETVGDVADILTFNHGPNGFARFTHADLAKYADRYPNKVCCSTGSCSTCTTRCGVTS